MNRYLKHKVASIGNLDLKNISIACVFISIKYQEVYPISLFSLIWHQKKITTSIIIAWEVDILFTVKFNVSPPTVIDFLDALSKDLRFTELIYDEAKFILYQIQINLHELKYMTPSQQTAVAMSLSLRDDSGIMFQSVIKVLNFKEFELSK